MLSLIFRGGGLLWQPPGVGVPPIFLAADLQLAESWTAAIRRSRTMQLLATIDLPASGVEGIEESIDARPDAPVAVWAAGPREASRIAERLVEHPGPSILHPPPARPPLGRGVQLAHGWLTLSGIGALERLFAARSAETVRLRVHGLPEGPAPGLGPALYHALTLVQRLGRDITLTRAVLETEAKLALTLVVDAVPWRVDVEPRGSELSLVVRTAEGDYAWTADGVSETLQRPRAEARAIPALPWAERCIRQLESPVKGADIADGRDARALVDRIEAALERPLPPVRFEVGSTHETLAPIGLSGELPPAAPLAPVAPPGFELPLEATAYILDLKPALFLTVAPQEEARVKAALPGFVERRERRVSVRRSDEWVDDRNVGEPRVELFAARSEDTLHRLVELQVADPSEALTEIGAILGYPACCVRTFAQLEDRSHNSYNRVAAAFRTSVGEPWPAVLDDTSLKLLPHFPCTYRCERSRQQAQRLLDALADEHPDTRATIDRYLGGPVLYFDHDHQLRFRGEVRDAIAIRYSAVSIPWSTSEPFARLGGAIAQGDSLVLGDGSLTVRRGEERLFSLRRDDPHLGVLMPFGARRP